MEQKITITLEIENLRADGMDGDRRWHIRDSSTLIAFFKKHICPVITEKLDQAQELTDNPKSRYPKMRFRNQRYRININARNQK